MHVMIHYVYHQINQDVIHGLNVAMEMHIVLIVPMNKIVQIGGVIHIMVHFFVKIEIVFMKYGLVMVRMIVVIIPMK
jgi:hypothetical protein